jgi:hypothetical protein
MQFGTLKMIFLEQVFTHFPPFLPCTASRPCFRTRYFRLIPPLQPPSPFLKVIMVQFSDLSMRSNARISFKKTVYSRSHHPSTKAQTQAWVQTNICTLHTNTITHSHSLPHTHTHEYSLPLLRAHTRTCEHTHQVTLHSTLGHIQEALDDLAQSVALAANTTRPAISSRLARLGRPQSLSVSVPPAIATLKSPSAAASFGAAAATSRRSARGNQSAACFSACAGNIPISYSPGPDKNRRHLGASPTPPTFPGVPQAAQLRLQLQSHIGADRAVPERDGSDSQRYPAPSPAQQPQNGLPSAGREDRRYFDEGFGGGGISGSTRMPVRGAARSGQIKGGLGLEVRQDAICPIHLAIKLSDRFSLPPSIVISISLSLVHVRSFSLSDSCT